MALTKDELRRQILEAKSFQKFQTLLKSESAAVMTLLKEESLSHASPQVNALLGVLRQIPANFNKLTEAIQVLSASGIGGEGWSTPRMRKTSGGSSTPLGPRTKPSR